LIARRALAAGLAISALLLNLAIEHVLAAARGDRGRLVLMAVLAAVAGFVGFMAWRSTNRMQAAGYGLVVGGALGNLADRAFGGAVFDYLFLHLGQISLFVFNFSDAAISAGALLVAAEALLSSRDIAR
jgi:signal peptidase II